MLRRLILLLVISIVIFGCAKKNTEYMETNSLKLLKTVPVVGNPIDISAYENRLFVAEDWGGFSEVNLLTYTRKWLTALPTIDGTTFALNRISKISYVGSQNRLFLNYIDTTDDVQVGNTENPDSTVLIDHITGGTNHIKDMMYRQLDDSTIEGAFCLDNAVNYMTYDGVQWLGFSHHYNATNPVNGFDLAGNYAYLAVGQRGLLIFDRETEAILGSIDLQGEAQKVKVVGNYAYVVCRQSGLQIVDISNPASPVLRGSFDTTGYATSIDVWNNYALVSSGGGGIYLIDVTNPAYPVLKDNVTSCGYTNLAKFNDGKVIVAARDQGILVYDISE